MKYLTLLIFICTTVIFPTFSQDTIHVPADYTTIQAAIDAAVNGDLVLVAENIYYENINFSGKAITVASYYILDRDTMHIKNTVIDGSQSVNPNAASVVRFAAGEDTSSVITGFIITGGLGTQWNNLLVGGGIYINGAAPTVRNNIIELIDLVSDNQGVFGSAIFASTANHKTAIIENNIIRNNITETTEPYASAHGTIFIYGYFTNVGAVIIRNNIISDNVVHSDSLGAFGAGIAVRGFNNPDFQIYIENNMILRNEAISERYTPNFGSAGGGIFLSDAQSEIKNNVIAFNSARWAASFAYGIIFPPTQCTTVVSNNTIYGNTGIVSAISTKKYYELNNCIIWGNSSPLFDPTHAAIITYSDIEEPYSNESNNITQDPMFIDTIDFYLNCELSPCVDAGNPDPMYNDVENPFNPGHPLPPACGTLRNDMGNYGGPESLWGKPQWPNLFEFPSIPDLIGPSGLIDTTEVLFEWTQSNPNVLRYWFEIADNDQFTNSFIDSMVIETSYLYSFSQGGTYWWRVKAHNWMGWSDFGNFLVVPVDDDNVLPEEYNLAQNYPNPFNPGTIIKFALPEPGFVTLNVYNILGEEVANIISEELDAGNYKYDWNAASLPSGIYLYRLQAENFVDTKKMILLK